jgi:hypothetical protein
LKSEGTLQPRFSYLSKFVVKLLEVAGTGLASAVGAYFLSQVGAPPAASPALMTPALVQVTATNEEMVRLVREEHAVVVELRKELDARRRPEPVVAMVQTPAVAATTPVPAPLPPKPTQAASSRHQKAERTLPAEAKPTRSGEPPPSQPAGAASQSLPKAEPNPKIAERVAAVPPFRVAASTSGEGEVSPVNKPKQNTAWVLPGVVDPPRPPRSVGDVSQGAM